MLSTRRFHRVMRWRAKPWTARLSGLLFLRRLPAGVRLITRHPRRPASVGTGFQNPNPPLQIGNDCPLSRQLISSRVSRLAAFRSSSVSTSLVCHNSPGHASVFPTALSQFTSSSLNSYESSFDLPYRQQGKFSVDLAST